MTKDTKERIHREGRTKSVERALDKAHLYAAGAGLTVNSVTEISDPGMLSIFQSADTTNVQTVLYEDEGSKKESNFNLVPQMLSVTVSADVVFETGS